jgi:transposase-like protein
MSEPACFERPPFCPNERCTFHRSPTTSWRWQRAGFFRRLAAPHRIQRFRCGHCGRHFSEQTFRTTYWLKRPELLLPLFHDLVKCAGFRQVARQHHASPQTIARHALRLGRHCQLFHEALRPRGEISEPLALDSFQSFEHSQYHPTLFHVVLGQRSHYWHGFTDSELRRSGRMSRAQKRRRAALEREFGRPDPRSVEREVARLLAIVAPVPQALELHTDEHTDYPRALSQLPHLEVRHRTISSRAARTTRNPLFPVNLLDLLIRHCGANHKRETIAFSKRRQSAAARLWVFLVWRNYCKWFSERHHGETPAMRLGVCASRWGVRRILARRLFPSRIELPERWLSYYRGLIPTRRIARARSHQLHYAC